MKKMKNKVNLVLFVALVFAVCLSAVRLLALQVDINRTRAENNALAAEVELQSQKNKRLETSLATDYDDDYIRDIARGLGYIMPGERIFADISGQQ